jgi:uncharacterized LabA/DUF88 family protein
MAETFIYAFIDSQNLNLGVKAQGWELDYQRFHNYLKAKYKVNKAFLFIGYIPENQRLYTYLQKCGYICVFKPTLTIRKKNQTIVKGNVDAELVLHAMLEYNNYSKSIIVTSDGDFHCLIDHLSTQNKLLKIITPNQRYSSLLRKFGSFILPITLIKEKVKKREAFPRE